MNIPLPHATPAGASHAAEAPATGTARLFRASLAQGRLHPLYRAMLNYRTARPEAAATTP